MQSPHLRNWPIRRKLMVIIVTTLAVSLLLVMIGLFAYELTTYRSRLANQVKDLAGFLAANAAPTLAFDDAGTADEILETLQSSSFIAVAALYYKDGRLFASYLRRGEPPNAVPQRVGNAGGWSRLGRFEIVRPVQQKGRTLGTLYLSADLANVYQRLTGYLGVLFIVSLAIAGGGILLQRLLRRLVSDPLLHLARTADTIAGGDLTVRFPVESGDELGQLAEAFNHMTSQLAQSNLVLREREVELRRAKDELEVRVEERTGELFRALQQLREESDERIRTVEELRNREQMLMQQNRLAAMGEMLVNISHQWRQPLNVVGLLLQDLIRAEQRGTFTPELLEKNVNRARELISHMSQTIDDFRSYLNPEKTKLPFDLREVVTRTVSLVGESLRGMQIEVVSRDDHPIMVDGFRNEYAQVLINILMNARDAFRERGVQAPRINVTIAKEEDKSVVTIADNAGGIASDVIDRVFEPYFTTKEADKGTGIGLFMSKNIIEKNMGGHLTVRNTAEGAAFRIEV